MKNFIKEMPIAISGTLLAVLSLGNLLNDVNVKKITLLIGLLIIAILILKLILYNDIVIGELKNPIVLSTSGTFSMALMVLSTYAVNISYLLSLTIWIMGVLLHITLIIYYTYFYIYKDFNINNYYGSLWVVYIGLTMGAISGGILKLAISWIFFLFGFCVMIPTIIMVSYRYIKYPVKVDANKPLICIYTAIFNILTVGYYYTFNPLNITFITILYLAGCCFYLFSLYKLIKYIKLPFYPSFSAFTFPFVISATASTKMLSIYPGISSIVIIETLIAILLVGYVLYEYTRNIILNG